MSPEQATGDRAIDAPQRRLLARRGAVRDARRRAAVHRRTAQAIIAKLLTDEPRSSVVACHRPAARRDGDPRALEKLPADRFESANAFALALQGDAVAIPEGVSTPGSFRASRGVARSRLRDPVVLALAALSVIATSLAIASGVRGSRDDLVTRMSLALPSEMPVTGAGGKAIAISADGRTIVYSGLFVEGGQNIFVRRLSDLQPRPLPGMQLALDPSISPTGAGSRMRPVRSSTK